MEEEGTVRPRLLTAVTVAVTVTGKVAATVVTAAVMPAAAGSETMCMAPRSFQS